MRLIIRNFIRIFQRFKLAMTLNILGFSVAFTAFMIILMQWQYDMTFDKDTPHADCIYRVDALGLFDMERCALCSQPMAETFTQSSPHIQGGGLMMPWPYPAYFSFEDSQGERQTYKEEMSICTPGITDVFRFDMLEGSADAVQVDDQVLIPESLARKLFGNESAVGKRLESSFDLVLGNGIYRVGGVFKDFPSNSVMRNHIYVPMGDFGKDEWGSNNASFYIRVDSPEAAAGLLDNFYRYAEQIGLEKKMQGGTNIGVYEMDLVPLRELHFIPNAGFDFTPKANRTTVYLLFSIAWVILIIAAINFTNFNTALSPIRMKSINTQRVLGSTVGTLRRNLTIETMLVSFLAYLLSVYWLYVAESLGIGQLVTADLSITRHWGLVLFTGIISLLLGAVAGLYPAYYMTSFQPALVLKGSFGLSASGRKLRTALMSIQYTTAFILIIGSIFMALQNRYMRNYSLGYDKENIIVAEIGPKSQAAYKAVKSDLQQLSGVKGVTFAFDLISTDDNYGTWGRGYKDKDVNFFVLWVESSFTDVMNIPMVEGRYFLPADTTYYGTLIINKAMADKYGIPVGEKVSKMPVVGIMQDIQFMTMRKSIEPMAFVTSADGFYAPQYLYVKAEAGTDSYALREQIAQTLDKFDPNFDANIRFFDAALEQSYQSEQNLTTMISLFSFLAVFISIVGVFGMVVFDSEYKRKEIGVRKVLGSTTAQILILFNKNYIKILLCCFIVAAPCAWYGVRTWLESFAYKIPIYWWVFPLAFLMIALITIATVTYQNWHAANENPVNSIKSE